MKTRVIIAGGRDFANYDRLQAACNYLLYDDMPDVIVVSGNARGADQLGKRWAQENGLQVSLYPADWDRYGKSAGYIRNTVMAKNADVLIAFWDGESRGTRHMIEIAKEHGLRVHLVKYS